MYGHPLVSTDWWRILIQMWIQASRSFVVSSLSARLKLKVMMMMARQSERNCYFQQLNRKCHIRNCFCISKTNSEANRDDVLIYRNRGECDGEGGSVPC